MKKDLLNSDQAQYKYSVYSWGSGNYGQLGLGQEMNKSIPTKINDLEFFDIISIESKNSVCAALTSDGKVLTWGKAKSGALGQPNNNINVSLPQIVEALYNEKIVFINCGNNHMAAITNEGKLYTWGNKEHGKLGHQIVVQQRKSNKDINTHFNVDSSYEMPQLVKFQDENTKIKQVACGTYHTVKTFKRSLYLQITISTHGGLIEKVYQDLIQTPKMYINLKKFLFSKERKSRRLVLVMILISHLRWMVNYMLGEIMITLNQGNQEFLTYNSLTQYTNLEVKDFSCGDYYMGVVTKSGELYTWGYGNDGQLGHQNKSDVKFPKKQKISCGNGHTGIITKNGELFMVGRGKEGQLGREDVIESSAGYRTFPLQVISLKGNFVQEVKCGGEHTIALVKNN